MKRFDVVKSIGSNKYYMIMSDKGDTFYMWAPSGRVTWEYKNMMGDVATPNYKLAKNPGIYYRQLFTLIFKNSKSIQIWDWKYAT